MNTRFIGWGDKDYVQLEFLLNPQNRLAEHEVFVSGSFNNWSPDASWLMKWDEEMKLQCVTVISFHGTMLLFA